MDYRHTEDFARQMEAAALRAPALRAQAANAFWKWVFAGIGRAAQALRHRLAGGGRADTMRPEG
jgi:hypothetical protein